MERASQFADTDINSFLHTILESDDPVVIKSANKLLLSSYDNLIGRDAMQQRDLMWQILPAAAEAPTRYTYEDVLSKEPQTGVALIRSLPRYRDRSLSMPKEAVHTIIEWFRKPQQPYDDPVNTLSRGTNFVNYRLLGHPLYFVFDKRPDYDDYDITAVPETLGYARISINVGRHHHLAEYNNQLMALDTMSEILMGSEGTGGKHWYAHISDFAVSVACMRELYNYWLHHSANMLL